jgi:hypothetical protein
LEYPGKSCPSELERLSYLKESSTDTEGRKPLATCRLALQINSSTFGTLLSSQGSSAHRVRPLGLAAGQPSKTYRVAVAPSNRVPAPSLPARHRTERSRADRACTRTTSVEVKFKGVSPRANPRFHRPILEYPGKSCPTEAERTFLPKGIIDRYRRAWRSAEPADWRYKLIRRLLAHC